MASQTAGKKKILIALQKPTVVLGNAEPMDSIHRYLSRSYAIGPVRSRWIVGGVLGACALGFTCFWTATQIWSVKPRTINAEWREATAEYRAKSGSGNIVSSHVIGEPVPAIPKPSARITDN